MKSSKVALVLEAIKLQQMQIKTKHRTYELLVVNRSPFGIHKVLLHRMIETVTMVVTMNPWTSHRKLVLGVAAASKAADSSIKAHRNIKVKVADKNNMPPLSISNRHLTLETMIINRILATLHTEKSCNLPIKIGKKDSRMNLTIAAVGVDKVAEIGIKTTKAVVMVAVVVGEEVVGVEKEISIIMIGNSRPTHKITKRAKNK